MTGILSACPGGGGSGDNLSNIRAGEVKDKESLRAFIRAAKKHLEDDYAQAKVDFRKESGRWRDGKRVSLFILNRSGEVEFHSIWKIVEGQRNPLTDLRTNKTISPQLRKAAFERGGGFVDVTLNKKSRIIYVESFKKENDKKANHVIGGGFFLDDDE